MRGLLWLERSLAAAGVVFGLWWSLSLAQAAYFSRLPVPAARVLPGESAPDEAAPAPAPAGRGAWVARLEAPAVGLATTVLEGSDAATLAKAAGRIEYTARPGAGSNLGIAGHRDTVFRPLRELKVGNTLVLTTEDRVFTYRVTAISIVEPDHVQVLDPTEHPTLTLVTCYPFTFIGHAPRRFIVAAQLVEERPRAGR
jgi:sortase A